MLHWLPRYCPKFEWCFPNHPEVDGGLGVRNRDRETSDNPRNPLLQGRLAEGQPRLRSSQTPGCCVHVKEGVPLPTSHKGVTWASRGSPPPNSARKDRRSLVTMNQATQGRGGNIPQGWKPLCCSSVGSSFRSNSQGARSHCLARKSQNGFLRSGF